ncbi:MAG: M48 family metalloprotease [Chloroflexi bacterium]|nr:M48 family metalloprotease [Chloroflexota bacterium]
MNMRSRWSLIGRGIIALLLTIGFYGLALGTAFGLLYLIYVEFYVIGTVNLRLTVFAFIGAVIILWAIVPRVDEFKAPGPRITRKKYPALFEQIDSVARATGQTMPRDVYLIHDVNAFVTERGGMMGIGSRRVMGIGLPLLYLVTVDELRAILAHEFGHFHGGDTMLGPWIYKTRNAIIRTVVSLGNSALRIPFEMYANLFLRITNTVSRQQEFSADRLAARTVGAQAALQGLQKVHSYGPAFQAYFQQEFAPVLNSGYLPPMIQGFERFLKSPRVTELIARSEKEQLRVDKTDPYDTHPSLKQRVEALQGLLSGSSQDPRPASVLLQGAPNLETHLLQVVTSDPARVKMLREINWDEVLEKVYLPRWAESAALYAGILKDLTPVQLPHAAHEVERWFTLAARAGKLLPPGITPQQIARENQLQFVNNVIGAALVTVLLEHGWQALNLPGENITLHRDGHVLEPFSAFHNLANIELSSEVWQQQCQEFGIADIPLGK